MPTPNPDGAETPFGKIQPVFAGFDLATPGWFHDDSTRFDVTVDPAEKRSPRRRSPRRATSAVDGDEYVAVPSPRRSTRRRTTVARLGFPSMGDSTRESLANSIARSPEVESPSKPRTRARSTPSTEPEPRAEATPAVVAHALRDEDRRMSTPSSSKGNDLFERRLLDSARRKTLAPLPGHEEWEGLESSTPAPAAALRRNSRRKSFRPSPLRDLIDPSTELQPPPKNTLGDLRTGGEPTHATEGLDAEKQVAERRPPSPAPAPSAPQPEQQATPKNKFVLPPSVSTRKKRQSPGKALFQRASLESVDTPQRAPQSANAVSKLAQPKFLDELSERLSSRASTPEIAPPPMQVQTQPRPSSKEADLSRRSLGRSTRSSSMSDTSRSRPKRTVIEIGVGGRVRVSSPAAAQLVEEQERSLRHESDSSASLSRSDILIDMPGYRSDSRERTIADWSRTAFEETRRRSDTVMSSSSRLTRQGGSRSDTPASASNSASDSTGSGWTPLPPRPQNPTPRTASPSKTVAYDSDSLPSRPSAPTFTDSTVSSSAPKRPSNPTPTHAHPTREIQVEKALSKSANDAPVFSKPKPQPLAQSLDRPVRRVPVRKAVTAPKPAAPAPKQPKAVAETAPQRAKVAPAPKPAPKQLNKGTKRPVSDAPEPPPKAFAPRQIKTFPARLRNGPPVLTPAKIAKPTKPAPKSKLPVSQPPERGAKRAKHASPQPQDDDTPPHLLEALATPRVTVRRTPRRTPRTPAVDWPELGISDKDAQFTFEHRLRAAAEDLEPSVSYPSRADSSRPSRSEPSLVTAQSPFKPLLREEPEREVEVFSPEDEFEGIRQHGQELSALMEVTEEMSRVSQMSHRTPRLNAVVGDESEATPKAVPTPAPIVEEQEEEDHSFSRRIGGGVLNFLSGLIGTPGSKAASPTPAPPVEAKVAEVAEAVPMKQVGGPVTHPTPQKSATRRIRAAGGKENAGDGKASKASKPVSTAVSKKAIEKDAKDTQKRTALAPTTRTRAPLAPRVLSQSKAQPKQQSAESHTKDESDSKSKRKRLQESPQRNVRRKVPAALSKAPSRPKPIEDARPIRSLPKGGRVASSSSSVLSFTAAALARLPKPGATAAKASPVKIRDMERARDLAVRKAVFERWAAEHEQEASFASSFSASPLPAPHAALGETRDQQPGPMIEQSAGTKRARKLTVPVAGKTPGKASRQRAESRARFDAKVARRAEKKLREEEERERIRRQVEADLDAERRQRTVVRARPLPEMYRR